MLVRGQSHVQLVPDSLRQTADPMWSPGQGTDTSLILCSETEGRRRPTSDEGTVPSDTEVRTWETRGRVDSEGESRT